jgi:diguanylate cyclase (GGDEF)-like protein
MSRAFPALAGPHTLQTVESKRSSLVPLDAPSTASSWRRFGWIVYIALGGVSLLGYFLAPEDLRGTLYELFGLAGIVAIIIGVVVHRPASRASWLVAAAGLGIFVAGDATYGLIEKLGLSVFPSIADVLYITGEVLFILGLAGAAFGTDDKMRRPALLDGAMLATAVGMVLWNILLGQVVEAEVDPLSALTAMTYPVLDLVILTVLVWQLLLPSGRTASTMLLIAGLSGFFLADMAYTSLSVNDAYQAGQPIDAGWLLGYLLFGAAALHPSMALVARPAHDLEERISGRRMAFIAGALGVAVVGAALTPLDAFADVLVAGGGGCVVVALVVARLFSAMKRSTALLDRSNALQQALYLQTQTDALTGLPNRVAFTAKLAGDLASRDATAVLFLDLDRFKQVNDTWGHQTGDALLCQVSERLSSVVRAPAFVARLGGDEFGVIVDSARMADAQAVADRILATFSAPFELAQGPVPVATSIGIALGRRGETAESILGHADVTMYDAKRHGGARWVRFDPAEHGQVIADYRLANALPEAVRSNQLRLHFQPIVDLRTGRLEGLESLVRWQHPHLGLMAPGAFIPLAEEAGLVGIIDRWVAIEAAAQLRRWSIAGLWPDRLRLHVNVSAHDVEDGAAVESMTAALATSGIQPSWLVAEVTESALLDSARSRATLTALHGLGVGLSLDDFGTQYAVLASLGDLPFDILKLDRSLVATTSSPSRARLLEGIVRLSSSLGLATIAEGIETDAERRAVLAAGCTRGQGYLLGRPMGAAETGQLLVPRALAVPTPTAVRIVGAV